MREGSRFISFVLIVFFATVIRDVTAQDMPCLKPAVTVSLPDAAGCGGAGQVTVPEAGSVSAQLPESMASLVIPIRMRDSGRMLVPVGVNGSGTYAFLFDTGAAMTVLSHSLAKRLGLAATKEEQVHTFAGKVSLSAGRVDSLRIGNYQIVGSNVLIGDLGHLFNQSPEVDGILGQDILSRFNYLIDRRAASLEIEEGDNLVAALAGTKVSFERRAGVICVPVAGGALRLLLDSGNPYLVVYEDAARSCNAILAVSGDEGVVGSSLGRRIIRPTRIPSLEIGGIVLRNVPAYLATRGSGRSEDGFLPLHIFNSMYVNNLENFLIANPRRSRQYSDNRRGHGTGESRSG
jgi:predicted aspartyl protease